MWTKNRRTDGRRGQTLIMFAVMAAVLFGFMGLVLDGGMIYYEKRRVQNAADAGAMAGGHELWRGNTNVAAEVRPAVINDTGHNGYDDSNATISVNVPPASGPNAGNTNFVEVIVTRNVDTYFMRILNFTQAPVTGRAVAGLVKYADMCVLTLDRDDSAAFRTNGNPTVQADCGIMVNSADGCGLTSVGASFVSATWIGVSGNYCGGGTLIPTPEPNVPTIADPLWHIQPPDYSTWSNGSYDNSTDTYICPGGQCVFNSQIKINNGTHTFQPGTYVLMKGMKITGGDVTAIGVTFYNVNTNGNDHIDIGGNGVVKMEAPTSGPYKGILFYADRNSPDKNPGNKVGRGNSASYFKGVMYFPSQHLDWAGNAQTTDKWAMVISNTLDVSGTADVQVFKLPDDLNELPDISKVTMVE